MGEKREVSQHGNVAGLIACIFVFSGIVVQWVVDPPNGGPYGGWEWLGFIAATPFALIYVVEELKAGR